MRTIGTIFFLLVLVLPAHAQTPTVWVLGDSVTFDYGNYFVIQNPQWAAVDLGLGGETSAGGLARVESLLATNQAPTIAVLSWGTNDAVADYFGIDTTLTPDATASNIVDVALLLRAAGSYVIIGKPIGFVTPTCTTDPTNRTNLQNLAALTNDQRSAIENLARANSVDTFQMEHHSECSWWRDAFHPKLISDQMDVAPEVATAIHIHSDF